MMKRNDWEPVAKILWRCKLHRDAFRETVRFINESYPFSEEVIEDGKNHNNKTSQLKLPISSLICDDVAEEIWQQVGEYLELRGYDVRDWTIANCNIYVDIEGVEEE